jgi:hypothetical protein
MLWYVLPIRKRLLRMGKKGRPVDVYITLVKGFESQFNLINLYLTHLKLVPMRADIQPARTNLFPVNSGSQIL